MDVEHLAGAGQDLGALVGIEGGQDLPDAKAHSGQLAVDGEHFIGAFVGEGDKALLPLCWFHVNDGSALCEGGQLVADDI